MNLFFPQKKINMKEMINSIEKKSFFKRYINFAIGCFIIAIAYNVFVAPNDIVPGGIGGLAIILNEIFGINKALFIFLSGLFLLTVSYFILGKEKTRASILGSILFPLFVQMTTHINVWLDIDNSELLLATVFGGVLYGFGAGMVFKAGFTTGGTDIINQILSKYLKISIGKSMLLSDGLIVLSSAYFFGPINFMYSVIILYIISLMSDKVILGISDSKAFYIITDKEAEIKEYILKYLNHGVTVFKAKGGLNKEKENVLMCVLPTKDYYKLKDGIHQIDEEAFFVVTDAYEVFGGE